MWCLLVVGRLLRLCAPGRCLKLTCLKRGCVGLLTLLVMGWQRLLRVDALFGRVLLVSMCMSRLPLLIALMRSSTASVLWYSVGGKNSSECTSAEYWYV